MAKYRCTVCNWVYDDDKQKTKFAYLPESYACPICGALKRAFVPLPEGESNIKTNVADKIVEQLSAIGVRNVYGIPGDSNLPLIEALRKNSKTNFVLTRHEETAAFMASAHGKMTDEIGVCVSIAGPGATNLITGLLDSQTDRSPVLALLGQVPELYLGSEAFQEIDEVAVFKPFTEYVEEISKPSQALKTIMTATKYAYKRPGCSAVSMPTDILMEKLDEKIISVQKKIFDSATSPKETDLKRAADLINKTDKVVLFAGWGARHAGDLLVKISEKIGAPIATTSRAKGVVKETNSNALGVLGNIGSRHAALAVKTADLIVIIGSGFRQAGLIPANAKIIQIDIDSSRVGKTFDVDVGIVADGKITLQKLLPKLNKKNKNKEYFEEIENIQANHTKELQDDAKNLSNPIYQGYVIQALQKTISKDAIITVDVGDHTYWFYKKFICDGQKTYMCANMASMGFAFPAAMSAKIDFPNKQVVCITGDGGFGMLMSDFTTAVREKLGITIVVFNDGKLKNIKKEQERDHYPEYGVSFPNPNFAEYAKSCGGEGYRVEKSEELIPALKKALASKKPCIVDVVVDSQKYAHGVVKV